MTPEEHDEIIALSENPNTEIVRGRPATPETQLRLDAFADRLFDQLTFAEKLASLSSATLEGAARRLDRQPTDEQVELLAALPEPLAGDISALLVGRLRLSVRRFQTTLPTPFFPPR